VLLTCGYVEAGACHIEVDAVVGSVGRRRLVYIELLSVSFGAGHLEGYLSWGRGHGDEGVAFGHLDEASVPLARPPAGGHEPRIVGLRPGDGEGQEEADCQYLVHLKPPFAIVNT